MKKIVVFFVVLAITQVGLAIKSPDIAFSQEEGVVHRVDRGDTLWDISGKYFGDPMKWPDLWSQNRFLTNPNYIYPGLEIVVTPPGPIKEEIEYEVKVEKPKEQEKAKEVIPVKVVEKKAPLLFHLTEREAFSTGELVLGKPTPVGEMVETSEGENLLWAGKEIYLDLDRDYPEGTELGIFQLEGPVPVSGVSGNAYKKKFVGKMEIKKKFRGRYIGTITRLFKEIQKDDYLSEEIPQIPEITVRRTDDGLRGMVVCSAGGNYEFGARDVLYMSGGAKKGFQNGDLVSIYMPLKELQRMSVNVPGAKRFRKNDDLVHVARAIVIRVNENFSTIYVIDSEVSFNAPALVVRGSL